MKVQFKYPRKIGGKVYGKGQHDLPEAHADHWFVQALIKKGDMVVLGEPMAKAGKPEAKSEDASSEEVPSQPQKGKDKSKDKSK